MGRTGPWLARLRPAMDLDGGEEGQSAGGGERERGGRLTHQEVLEIQSTFLGSTHATARAEGVGVRGQRSEV